MITDVHPAVRALDALPYEATLIGSRALMLHRPDSDHDYLLVVPDSYEARKTMAARLKDAGFSLPHLSSYGPDPSADVYVWADPAGKLPPVDVVAVDAVEAARRLAFFAALRRASGADTKRAGQFHRAMKSEKAWPLLWETLRHLGVK